MERYVAYCLVTKNFWLRLLFTFDYEITDVSKKVAKKKGVKKRKESVAKKEAEPSPKKEPENTGKPAEVPVQNLSYSLNNLFQNRRSFVGKVVVP